MTKIKMIRILKADILEWFGDSGEYLERNQFQSPLDLVQSKCRLCIHRETAQHARPNSLQKTSGRIAFSPFERNVA
jgi:hypothetical protein